MENAPFQAYHQAERPISGSKHEFAIVNTSRWEHKYLVEWLNYHRSIGFNHAYIYCNDDDPREMYNVILPFIVGSEPFVTFYWFPYQGQQLSMYSHFLDTHKNECEWFMFVDTDEFLALKNSCNLREFMKIRRTQYDCIYFNWIWFGPQDYQERPDGSVLLQYSKRQDITFQMNYFTKGLTRSASIDVKILYACNSQIYHHLWPVPVAARMMSANVIGEPMDEYFIDFPARAEKWMSSVDRRKRITDEACIHHYVFRSRADFKRRAERGMRGNFWAQKMWAKLHESPDLEDFVARLNVVTDTFLVDYWKAYLARGADSYSLIPVPAGILLSKGKKATQSSTCEWSNHLDPNIDALGPLTGNHTGAYSFHTDIEDRPWWMVDLEASYHLTEIRIFNCVVDAPLAKRSDSFGIEVSQDGEIWETLFLNQPSVTVGGVDGHPFIKKCDATTVARFVRIFLRDRTYLQLDQIEVYGTPTSDRL